MAFKNIYTFGPTFRAERSKTRRHLTEFWMVEPEMAFFDLNDDMDLAEDMVEYIVQYVLKTCQKELATLGRDVSKLEEKAATLGVPLTPEQKNSVLEIITAERTSALSKYSPENIKNGVPLAGTSNEGSPTGGTPDPAAMIKAFEADQAAADQAALSKAEGILSDAQADLLLEVLREKMERRPPPMASPAPALPQN